MNRARRKKISTACAVIEEQKRATQEEKNDLVKRIETIKETIQKQTAVLDDVREEEDEALANVPESLQEADRFADMEENVSILEDSVSSLDEVIEQLDDCMETMDTVLGELYELLD